MELWAACPRKPYSTYARVFVNSDMTGERANHITSPLSDADLLSLFHSDPDRAWRLFIDRYADRIYSQLRHLGFDYDQAMDRFVYICEKLAEEDYRRLKTVRYTGSAGDLTPWVRKVVKNFSINWAWSEEGRKRLLKPISRMPQRERRIFELYFWRGLSPSAIREQIGLEGQQEISLADVFDALERIFSRLSQKKLWRLLSNLSRMRGTVSLDEINEETGTAIEPADTLANPEQAFIRSESEERLSAALDGLLPAERLSIQLRYEEGMPVKEIGEILRLSEKEVKSLLKSAMGRLRQAYR